MLTFPSSAELQGGPAAGAHTQAWGRNSPTDSGVFCGVGICARTARRSGDLLTLVRLLSLAAPPRRLGLQPSRCSRLRLLLLPSRRAECWSQRCPPRAPQPQATLGASSAVRGPSNPGLSRLCSSPRRSFSPEYTLLVSSVGSSPFLQALACPPQL